MFAPRTVAYVIAGLWMAATSAEAGGGYLAKGPPPIRFQAGKTSVPVVEEKATGALEPLSVAATATALAPTVPPVAPAETVAAPAVPPLVSEPAAVATLAEVASAGTTTNNVALSTVAAIPAVPVPQHEILSPQLLIPYFTGPQGGRAPSLILPVSFTPPEVPPRSVSKATYAVTR